MANRKLDINKTIDKFYSLKSIKATAKELGVSRNTVRRHLREMGALLSEDVKVEICSPGNFELDFELHFTLLERFFEKGRTSGETLDFKRDVMRVAQVHADEIGIDNTFDLLKLEHAMMEWISYRRFYFKSLKAAEERYEGPFEKVHEKLTASALGWRKAADKCLKNYHEIVRCLELRYGRIRPNFGSGNTFIARQEISSST